ncbi:MAG TPA: ABC transporter permease, partial [Mollicutes bacterium]|nr:ABC transporter permease [Mollicutes bacterium]
MNLLNKLTIKHLTMNKKRTLVTIIGVVLSCALMVGIGLIFASVRDYSIKNVKLYEGDYHIKISGITLDQINNIQAEKNISNVQYETSLGFALLENSKNEYKPYLYINGVSQSFLNNLNLISGRLPVNDNEIVISNHIKTNADVEYNIGDVLELDVGHRYFEGHKFFENGALLISGKENEKE